MSVDSNAWSERAGYLLNHFVQTACHSEPMRQRLLSQPAAALLKWQFEPSHLPESLPVTLGPLSVNFDDASLLGPASWRTTPPPDLLQQTQLRLLLSGAKPMALVHGDERSLTALANWARLRGYYTLLGPQAFSPQFDTDKGGYSNQMSKVEHVRAGSGAWRGLLIAADEQTVMLAWLCLLFGWEKFLGMLLGYPTCCCSAFTKRWPIAAANHEGDVGLLLLAEYQSVKKRPLLQLNWATNIFGRYFGWELVQHFPCSWDCSASAGIAHRHLAALTNYWPAEARQLQLYLSSPLLLLPSHGYALFPGGQIVKTQVGLSLVYNADSVQLIGLAGELANGILAVSSLTANLNGDWHIAGNHYQGCVLDMIPNSSIQGIRT